MKYMSLFGVKLLGKMFQLTSNVAILAASIITCNQLLPVNSIYRNAASKCCQRCWLIYAPTPNILYSHTWHQQRVFKKLLAGTKEQYYSLPVPKFSQSFLHSESLGGEIDNDRNSLKCLRYQTFFANPGSLFTQHTAILFCSFICAKQDLLKIRD